MPNIKSAKKRVKVSAKKQLDNKMAKNALKTCIKSFDASLNGENAESSFKAAVKTIDKAVAKGLLHKNTASRKKSAIAKKYNASVNA